LIHNIITPHKKLPKVYEVDAVHAFRGNESQIFSSGDLLLKSDTEPCKPALFEKLEEKKARITLNEGRYHQIIRMFGAIGNRVQHIHRTNIGPLSLKSMKGNFSNSTGSN